jgi:hypothetical protein
MKKMKMESKDIVKDNIETISHLFPTCVKESVSSSGEIKK